MSLTNEQMIEVLEEVLTLSDNASIQDRGDTIVIHYPDEVSLGADRAFSSQWYIFDPKEQKYTCGVLNKFNQYLDEGGWWAEWYNDFQINLYQSA